MDILAPILTILAFLSVPGYLILQIIAWWKLRGTAQLLACVPLLFMLPIYCFCLYALSRGSNLWPLWAIFASPVAFLITLLVFIGSRYLTRTNQQP
jgi:hypothetical protein